MLNQSNFFCRQHQGHVKASITNALTFPQFCLLSHVIHLGSSHASSQRPASLFPCTEQSESNVVFTELELEVIPEKTNNFRTLCWPLLYKYFIRCNRAHIRAVFAQGCLQHAPAANLVTMTFLYQRTIYGWAATALEWRNRLAVAPSPPHQVQGRERHRKRFDKLHAHCVRVTSYTCLLPPLESVF